jgi:tetratricopeptide (TPR) repeat protein
VVVAKARDRRAVPREPLPARDAGDGDSAPSMPAWSLAVMALGLGMAGFVGLRVWQKAHPPPPPPIETSETAARPRAATVDAPLPSIAPPMYVPPEQLHVDTAQVPDADRARADELVRRLASPASLTAADVQAAEDLLSRHSDERPLRNLLEAVLIAASSRHQQQHQFPQAIAYLQRAQQVQPTSTRGSLALMEVAMQTGDWALAEAAARAILALDPRHFDAWQGLGYALMRQDRNRDAMDAFRTALAIREDSTTRALLARIEKGLADERGMAERRVSHFNVRYDGAEHEAVGREIVRQLEHHYATLATRFEFEPTATIPVILFTTEGYYNASGAPAWSGGAYDLIDGRIRIPIGGITASLTPDMDDTLIHELTHAFIADRTRGAAPEQMRRIHEGTAQYMAGHRIESELDREQLRALADGRLGGVGGFYLGALAFVEYLIANRGQGGINDLLKAIGETGNVDEAFRQVYGTTQQGASRAFVERFRQQYGSV